MQLLCVSRKLLLNFETLSSITMGNLSAVNSSSLPHCIFPFILHLFTFHEGLNPLIYATTSTTESPTIWNLSHPRLTCLISTQEKSWRWILKQRQYIVLRKSHVRSAVFVIRLLRWNVSLKTNVNLVRPL